MEQWMQEKDLSEIIGTAIEPAFPKAIAEITLCGATTFRVYEGADFVKPTEEQRKNLKEMLCIDVRILDGE